MNVWSMSNFDLTGLLFSSHSYLKLSIAMLNLLILLYDLFLIVITSFILLIYCRSHD